MATAEFMGKTFTVDEDGFIDAYENFCPEWVQWVNGPYPVKSYRFQTETYL